MMNIKNLAKLLILCLIPALSTHLYAMDGGGGQADPLARMNYRLAFDQGKIHEKFGTLMERWGCAENVFDAILPDDAIAIDMREFEPRSGEEYQPLSQSEERVETEASKAEEKAYQQACLKKLSSARRWTITEDAREALTTLSLIASAATTLNLILPADSMGGSFGVFAAVFNAAFLMRPVIRPGCNLLVAPTNPLESLEERFALSQCFIPKKLWPIIREKFMLARTNQFQQRTCMDFLEFALGLTLFKPKPTLETIDNLEERIVQLFEKIDSFFDQYEEFPSEELWKIKDNVQKFIRSLLNENLADAPRYIYLHGSGGIGKTHFVNQLTEWIEELIPQSVRVENLEVSNAEELEGSAHRPGAMLTVLRNQLMGNKRGSVVFMDEATWLNRSDMVSTAKRVFNGNQSKISTSYFGNGIDGSGIELQIPPMLIFVASNDKINDPALKTRFDSIDFPLPKKERLIEYAKKIASESILIKEQHIDLEAFDFEHWLEQSKADNFRDIASQIVPAILSQKQ
ncbi:TPA: hypothetical protein DIC20_01855 [Candidatus Dependentiae bacterium]|nr:hypothetical protein [Candidatus Dependentiae bacterium]HCU00431.1 hypothetical protein [Candidatus Dependentiae bacterium]